MLTSIQITRRAAAIALASLLLGGCGQEDVAQTKTVVIQPALTEVVSSSINDELSFNGVVRAAERANLAFRVGGLITDIRVKEGDYIKQGDLLAKLDARDAKTALASAELELQSAEDDYNRAKAIFDKSRAISKSDLDAITTRFNLVRNRVDEAKRQYEYTELRAPFDGIIGRKLVDNHIQIQANAPVLVLHDLSDLEVVINLPYQMMLSEHNQATVNAELSAVPGQLFPLALRTWATEADPVSQTYPVVFGFDDLKGFRVLPGMAVKVTASSTRAEGALATITVPLTAVVPDNQGGQFVWVVGSDNRVKKRFVKVGNLNNNRIEIRQHLSNGERVIIAGVSSLKEGMEVRPYTDSPGEKATKGSGNTDGSLIRKADGPFIRNADGSLIRKADGSTQKSSGV
ncbi:efflux RND transporter periplasmic adaptor subunit [Endozoicomonas sp. GU-1]|uniref:efflux RND transporter periplasmic adaptor subunit n=2 Tax=unclassified Endozoicomonas TaxID=2644528 RepID=UPI0022B326A0|nr:efflux RND transporter periplasmic adaptor subunit [Endozoicomonas sp. GU-1]WBA83179.1 efflux RND transporter periplasmic adaptor subunit [Endozoicomonas sp. GU-1]WBA86104.1 efflux RND transporter periplasmic adaptor subunit [Endozoicomonas sp. GU-1]